MKSPNLKISFKETLILMKLLAIIIIIGIFAYAGYFLYKNFYQVITGSEEVAKLQKNITEESINMNYFNEIIEALEKKVIRKDVSNINNPFD